MDKKKSIELSQVMSHVVEILGRDAHLVSRSYFLLIEVPSSDNKVVVRTAMSSRLLSSYIQGKSDAITLHWCNCLEAINFAIRHLRTVSAYCDLYEYDGPFPATNLKSYGSGECFISRRVFLSATPSRKDDIRRAEMLVNKIRAKADEIESYLATIGKADAIASDNLFFMKNYPVGWEQDMRCRWAAYRGTSPEEEAISGEMIEVIATYLKTIGVWQNRYAPMLTFTVTEDADIAVTVMGDGGAEWFGYVGMATKPNGKDEGSIGDGFFLADYATDMFYTYCIPKGKKDPIRILLDIIITISRTVEDAYKTIFRNWTKLTREYGDVDPDAGYGDGYKEYIDKEFYRKLLFRDSHLVSVAESLVYEGDMTDAMALALDYGIRDFRKKMERFLAVRDVTTSAFKHLMHAKMPNIMFVYQNHGSRYFFACPYQHFGKTLEEDEHGFLEELFKDVFISHSNIRSLDSIEYADEPMERKHDYLESFGSRCCWGKIGNMHSQWPALEFAMKVFRYDLTSEYWLPERVRQYWVKGK